MSALPRILLLLALALAAGCASQPTATFRETYQDTKTGDQRTRTRRELVDVGLEGELGPGFEYRLADRLVNTNLQYEAGDLEADEHRLLHQPSLDMILTAGFVSWTQGYELQQTKFTPSVGPDNDRTRTDLLQKVEWTPLGLPSVTAWFNRRAEEDDLFLDRTDTESVVEVRDVRGPFNWLYSFENEVLEDHQADVQRDRNEHLLRANYTDEHADGRLATNLGLFIDERRTADHLPTAGGGVAPPGEVFPNAGLSLLDLTPQIATLDPNPALIDGNDTVGAGINIGGFASGGETSWNIGVGLPSRERLNLVLLSTADELAPQFVNQFSFSVWVSDDNNFWTQVTTSASYSYDGGLRRFQINLPEAEGRYLKVVNTASPPAAPAVLVSEMRVFGPTPTGGGGARVDRADSTRHVTGALSWRATERLTLGYDVFAQSDERETDDVATKDETRLDNALSALYQATDRLALSVRGREERREDTVREDQLRRQLNGLVDWQALDTLDVAFNYTHIDEQRDDRDSFQTDAAEVRSSAQLLEHLVADVSVEKNTQRDFDSRWRIDRTILRSSLVAGMTPALDLTLAVRTEDATVSGAGADTLPDPSEESYEVIATYQPSSKLTAEMELDWRDTFSGSGLDQRWSLGWLPLRDGAVDVQLDYLRQVSGTFDTRRDQVVLQTRWTVNPKAFFELSYAWLDPNDAERTETFTFSFNLRL